MPIFEYQCEKCGHVFEHFVFGDAVEEAKTCPKCQTPGGKRVLSSFSSLGSGSGEGGCGGSCGSGRKGFS